MKNTQEAIFPLLFTLCLCGFRIFEYPRGQPRLYFTILYILTSWLFYSYILIKVIIFFNKYKIHFPLIIKTSSIFVILYTLLNLYYNKKFENCLNKLNIINDTLEKLGTTKNYAKLHIRIIWLIITWAIANFLMDTIDSIWLFDHVPESYAVKIIYLPYVVNHPLHMNRLMEMTFLMMLKYIESRFEHVNRHIERLMEEKKRQIRHAWATSTSSSLIRRHMTNTKTLNQIICILMHVHFELSMISREITTIFGIQMVMHTATIHVFTVQLIFELYFTFIKNVDASRPMDHIITDSVNVLFFTIVNIIYLIIYNYVCEEVCNKANKTELFLNRLANLTFDVEIQENITQFLLQLLKRRLKVSVLGLYNFGYKFLYEFIKWTAMIIILIIQTNV